MYVKITWKTVAVAIAILLCIGGSIYYFGFGGKNVPDNGDSIKSARTETENARREVSNARNDNQQVRVIIDRSLETNSRAREAVENVQRDNEEARRILNESKQLNRECEQILSEVRRGSETKEQGNSITKN